jgi:hypothetical protein
MNFTIVLLASRYLKLDTIILIGFSEFFEVLRKTVY